MGVATLAANFFRDDPLKKPHFYMVKPYFFTKMAFHRLTGGALVANFLRVDAPKAPMKVL